MVAFANKVSSKTALKRLSLLSCIVSLDSATNPMCRCTPVVRPEFSLIGEDWASHALTSSAIVLLALLIDVSTEFSELKGSLGRRDRRASGLTSP